MTLHRLVLGQLMTNCYIVKDKGSGLAAVIDPADEVSYILDELTGYTPAFILLTHGHFDHILALDDLRKATGMPVYLHEADADFLTDAKKNCSLLAFGRHELFRPAEQLLKGGETIPFGEGGFTVLHTPGHTPGSVCYRIGNLLFSGDTLFECGMGRTDLYGGDPRALESSLETLFAIRDNPTVLPGHGNATDIDTEKGNGLLSLL